MPNYLHSVAKTESILQTHFYQIINELKDTEEDLYAQLVEELKVIAPNLIVDWDFAGLDVIALFKQTKLHEFYSCSVEGEFYYFHDDVDLVNFAKMPIQNRPYLFVQKFSSEKSQLVALLNFKNKAYIYHNTGELIDKIDGKYGDGELSDVQFVNANWFWVNYICPIGERNWFDAKLIYKYSNNQLELRQSVDINLVIIEDIDAELIKFLEAEKDKLPFTFFTKRQLSNKDTLIQMMRDKIFSAEILSFLPTEIKNDSDFMEQVALYLKEYQNYSSSQYEELFDIKLEQNEDDDLPF